MISAMMLGAAIDGRQDAEPITEFLEAEQAKGQAAIMVLGTTASAVYDMTAFPMRRSPLTVVTTRGRR